MISTFTAFFDANVFFGARLRSLVITMAQSGFFRARWSEQIHREWMTNVVAKRPGISMADLEPTRRAMDDAVPDCLVTGYEPLITSLVLPDESDRHVLAAAIVAKASVLVTFNRKDFPEDVLDSFGIGLKHPDEFLMDLGALDSFGLIRAAKEDLNHYRKPPLSLDGYLDDLRKAGVPDTAEYLSRLKVLVESTNTTAPRVRRPKKIRRRMLVPKADR